MSTKKYPKLTKERIEELANDILKWAQERECDSLSLFYNNKQVELRCKYDICDDYKYIPKIEVYEGINPLIYTEYAGWNHILTLTFDGYFYDIMHTTGFPKRLEDKFQKFGVYHEMGHSWDISFFPLGDEDDIEVEYTVYERPKEEVVRYIGNLDMMAAPSTAIATIMQEWYNLSKATGDGGSCVLGAGFRFEYGNEKYFMSACSPYQGSLSWEPHVEHIKSKLEEARCINVTYDCGRMD